MIIIIMLQTIAAVNATVAAATSDDYDQCVNASDHDNDSGDGVRSCCCLPLLLLQKMMMMMMITVKDDHDNEDCLLLLSLFHMENLQNRLTIPISKLHMPVPQAHSNSTITAVPQH